MIVWGKIHTLRWLRNYLKVQQYNTGEKIYSLRYKGDFCFKGQGLRGKNMKSYLVFKESSENFQLHDMQQKQN